MLCHGKATIFSMEIRKPRLGVGRFMKLSMTQIPSGCKDSSTFK